MPTREDCREVLRRLEKKIPAALCFAVKAEDGTLRNFRRRFVPPARLILLGGGHISQALCRFAAELDFSVAVVDDRPSFANYDLFPAAAQILCDQFAAAIDTLAITPYDYVAVLTRGHRWDGECLRKLFRGAAPSYLGLIGSRRRVAGLFSLLREEGYDPKKMEQVRTPIGLKIGAVTPKEIAVSILAELIACRHASAPEQDALSLENAELPLLRALAEGKEPQALAIVVRTAGSVPVQTGAMMVVDSLGGTIGTVGGGCGEYEVIRAARSVLGAGKSGLLELDMTNDVAESDGMVCGGRMEVWIEPCL